MGRYFPDILHTKAKKEWLAKTAKVHLYQNRDRFGGKNPPFKFTVSFHLKMSPLSRASPVHKNVAFLIRGSENSQLL